MAKAREVYALSTGKDVYNMVVYSICMHCDHFKGGKESLENKLLFCMNPKSITVGRGGWLVR